jgi:hypothetical protein
MHKATPLEGPRQRPRRVPKGRRRPASVASGQTASVQVIRCDIKRESVEKFRHVQNEPISGKRLRVSP